MAEARLAQRHKRVLLDPAAEVSGLGVAHDLTRVADRLQIADDDFVERRSFRGSDLTALGRGGDDLVVAASSTSDFVHVIRPGEYAFCRRRIDRPVRCRKLR
jgi:hypothetical protein